MSRVYDLTRKANKLINNAAIYKDIDILVDLASITYLIDKKEISIYKISRYLNTLRDKNIKCSFEINLI